MLCHTRFSQCDVFQSCICWLAGFDGSVCVWDVSLNANNEPHLLHAWQAHPGTEILAMVHDAMKNVIVTAGNDNHIKVSGFSPRCRTVQSWCVMPQTKVILAFGNINLIHLRQF